MSVGVLIRSKQIIKLMKLSEKLRQLQKEAQDGELTQDAIEDGFNRCIEDAERLELDQKELQCLNAAGVDNWEGHEIAMEMMEQD